MVGTVNGGSVELGSVMVGAAVVGTVVLGVAVVGWVGLVVGAFGSVGAGTVVEVLGSTVVVESVEGAAPPGSAWYTHWSMGTHGAVVGAGPPPPSSWAVSPSGCPFGGPVVGGAVVGTKTKSSGPLPRGYPH